MKKLIMAVALGISTLVAAAPAQAQHYNRGWNQEHRIYNGYRSGQLTRREAYRLQRQQNRIGRYAARSRWDGGGYSWRERQRIDRMRDRASRNIYRNRHDNQYRPYAYR